MTWNENYNNININATNRRILKPENNPRIAEDHTLLLDKTLSADGLKEIKFSIQ